MEEKRYLKWYNKCGYALGELGSNFAFTTVSSFAMIYLTDAVGMNSVIIGTLIAIAKLLDGVTDVFFGSIIDRTHTKMGKARPWMVISTFGLAITLILEFTIPVGWSDTMKYAYFFIVYVVLNAVFYTAFEISHSALISLITKNTNERVQISSIRTMFGFVAAIVLSSVTMVLVNALGGGAAGWRNTAIVYAVLCILLNLLTVASVRELSDEEIDQKQMEKTSEQKAMGVWESLKTLIKNKYYIMILVINVCIYLNTAIYTAVGAYYSQYILGNPAMLGSFVIVSMLPMAISIAFTPVLVKKAGSIYKVNVIGHAFSIIFSIFYVVAGYMGNVTLMLVMLFLSGLGAGPLTKRQGSYVHHWRLYI